MVIKYGGQLKFSNDIVFSSSNIINNHINPKNDLVRKNLEKFKQKGGLDYFKKLVEKVRSLKILYWRNNY